MFLARPEPITEDSVDPVWKYFPGCLGALDGTHVKGARATYSKNRYRSRKGEISTNVLAVCNKNMNFIYVLSGWEASTADSRVLSDAMSREPVLQVHAVDPIEDQFNNVPESVDNNDYIDNVEPSVEWSDWRDNLVIDMYNEWRNRMDSQTGMQIPQEKLGRGRRQKAPKKFWSKNEELVCIGLVKELIKGGWRSGNGWRGGFYSEKDYSRMYSY